MVITASDLGADEDVARRVLVRARSIAPCIANFARESEPWKDAVAILKGVIAELPKAGSSRTRSMSRNGTSMTFEISRAFSVENIELLKALCSADVAEAPGGHPVGSFPTGGIVSQVWPEGEYR